MYVSELAKKYVKKGNLLLKQNNVCEAIIQYNKAIKVSPYYAIPYFNKRIALAMHDDMDRGERLIDGFEEINLEDPASSTCFVVSTVATVPEYEFSEDSSEEEVDEEFYKLYNPKSDCAFPFTTNSCKKTIKHKTKQVILNKNIISTKKNIDSKIVNKILSKVHNNGFEGYVNDSKMLTKIAFSIGLNRMYSLSTRKNNSLPLELESCVTTKEIKYKLFGFYWLCDWYTDFGKSANFHSVRSFYKKLKSIRPDLAKKFIEQEKLIEENRNYIPYQDIREYAKNNIKTKDLISEFRKNNLYANIYLHLVDADLHDFNGVYSAYLRIIDGCYKIPTIMSTGYEFPKDPQYMAYQLLGHMERMHRVITSFYVPLGTYYPEPNMCILVPPSCDTIVESFIDHKRVKHKALESPILLTNIGYKRRNVSAIFSEDNPIITAIPKRAKLCKQNRQEINFSHEFNEGPAAPTNNDISKYSQVSQSHTNPWTWCNSLFLNNAVGYDNHYETDGECILDKKNKPLKGVDKQCKKLISNIRNNIEVNLSITKLYKRIGEDNTKAIVAAINAINKFRICFNKNNERTNEEQELIDIMNKHNIDIIALSREVILNIVNTPLMGLLRNSLIDLNKLCNLDIDVLEHITRSDEIIQALCNEPTKFDDIITCLEDNPECFLSALDNYSVVDILECYCQNPLHLKFMGGDPWDIAYTNSDDYEILEFAVKHQYIDNEDIDSINKELIGDREDSASSMMFTAIIEWIKENEYYNSNTADDNEYF